MVEYVAKVRVAEAIGKPLHILVVADIHDLGDDPLRHLERVLGTFPPDVAGGQFLEQVEVLSQLAANIRDAIIVPYIVDLVAKNGAYVGPKVI
ncbi:MAG TPA: hypothetical protein VFX38_06505, partial [Gammaproteobacteria bacterium]|nr:hypothetical protein [Gammaproteobacteria bacterium]